MGSIGLKDPENSQPGPASAETRDAALVQRILGGETALFHELIRPYERGIYAVACAVVKNAGDAEEVAQEALLKAFRSMGQLREPAHFRPWLMRIARNEAQLRRRREKRHLYEALEADDSDRGDYRPRQFADWRDLPSDYAELQQLREAVRLAIEALPIRYREIYVLSDNQKLTMEDLAQVLDITVSSAKTRLHRARLLVQEKLTPVYRRTWQDRLKLMKGMNPWSPVRR